MSLCGRIAKLCQDTSSVTHNPLLTCIDLEFLEDLETTKADQQIAILVDKLEHSVAKAQIDSIDSLQQFFTAYGEARIYQRLKAKWNVKLVPEASSKTPDFQIQTPQGHFFGEVKSLLMIGGIDKYRQIMSGGLDTKISVEKQVGEGKPVGVAYQVIQPHFKPGAKYDAGSVRMVIENLIGKFEQNFKSEQYALGPTVSLVYLNSSHFQLCSGSVKKKCAPIFFDNDLRVPVSGELWNAVFGVAGDKIFRRPEWEGKSNVDGVLKKSGILQKHEQIKAICFYVEDLSGAHFLAGFFRSNESPIVTEAVANACDSFNDEESSRTFALL